MLTWDEARKIAREQYERDAAAAWHDHNKKYMSPMQYAYYYETAVPDKSAEEQVNDIFEQHKESRAFKMRERFEQLKKKQ